MPYRALEDRFVHDIGFEIRAGTLSELFAEAWTAVLSAMVDNPGSIREQQTALLDLSHSELDILLFDMLGELIYRKDAEQSLYLAESVEVTDHRSESVEAGDQRKESRKVGDRRSGYTVRASLYGERIDVQRHTLMADVKAVTLDGLSVEQHEGLYRATITLDT